MKGEFETNNLSNLIEITARNIEIIYKFSGLLDFPFLNTTGDIIFVYFLLFVDLDYHLLLSRNTKYLIGCLISQHSNDI